MPSLTSFSVDRVLNSSPSKRMAPVKRTMLQIDRNVVVLPAPLDPNSVVTLPSRKERSMP